MRAAVMRDEKIVVGEVPIPTPGPGEVLVKTLACGICGSDLHTLAHGHQMVKMSRETDGIFDMDLSRDVVMGHEFCGEILDYGPETTGKLPLGSRVCAMPVLMRGGKLSAVGYSNDAPGGFGEQMVVLESMLSPVKNGLATDLATLTEPMAVGCHAVEMARLQKNEVPLVIGCGPVGLAVITALKLKGVGPIVAADFSPARRKLAEKVGADIVVDPRVNSPYETWTDMARMNEAEGASNPYAIGPPTRPGVYFECVGVPGVMEQMIIGAPRACRIVIVGLCMEQDHFMPYRAISKEINIQFALGYGIEEFTSTLHNISEGLINVEPMITGKVGLDGVAAAFKDLKDPERHAKILVEPWR